MVTSAHLSEDRRQQLELANLELQQVSARVTSAQDGERRRIASELHDGVGQYLAAIKMSTEVALERSKRADIAAPLHESINLLDRCMAEVRTMSCLLHPPLLEEIGLASAIPWLVEGFMQRSGVQVDLKMPAHLERLPQPVELALFRVLRKVSTTFIGIQKAKSRRLVCEFWITRHCYAITAYRDRSWQRIWFR